jgi:hypothetical protein
MTCTLPGEQCGSANTLAAYNMFYTRHTGAAVFVAALPAATSRHLDLVCISAPTTSTLSTLTALTELLQHTDIVKTCWTMGVLRPGTHAQASGSRVPRCFC